MLYFDLEEQGKKKFHQGRRLEAVDKLPCTCGRNAATLRDSLMQGKAKGNILETALPFSHLLLVPWITEAWKPQLAFSKEVNLWGGVHRGQLPEAESRQGKGKGWVWSQWTKNTQAFPPYSLPPALTWISILIFLPYDFINTFAPGGLMVCSEQKQNLSKGAKHFILSIICLFNW